MKESKQAMARKLIELGCDKAFNTLRKYPAELLATMLSEEMAALEHSQASTAPVVEPCVTVESAPVATPETTALTVVPKAYIPTDAEIMAHRRSQTPVVASEPVRASYSPLAVCMGFLGFLRGVVGL